jgi:hypothetical protein
MTPPAAQGHWGRITATKIVRVIGRSLVSALCGPERQNGISVTRLG